MNNVQQWPLSVCGTGSDTCYDSGSGFTDVAQFSMDYYDTNDTFIYNRPLDPTADPLVIKTLVDARAAMNCGSRGWWVRHPTGAI